MTTKTFLEPALGAEECELRGNYAAFIMNKAERHRREQPTVGTTPLRGVIDYSTAGVWIAQAMHHLDESLPSGQKERGAAAFIALAAGVQALGVWMSACGYDVPGVALTTEVGEMAQESDDSIRG